MQLIEEVTDKHYYNSNLIWCTVSQDLILYARSSYYYNYMFIIYFFLILFCFFYKFYWPLIQKNCEKVCLQVSFLDVLAWNFLNVILPQKQVIAILKYSDTELENLSLLIHLSVSDGQKTDSSKDVSFIGIISNK